MEFEEATKKQLIKAGFITESGEVLRKTPNKPTGDRKPAPSPQPFGTVPHPPLIHRQPEWWSDTSAIGLDRDLQSLTEDEGEICTRYPMDSPVGMAPITLKDRLVLIAKKTMLTENLRDYTNSMLVVATLIATVSFTAGFTLPGGYQGDGPDQGMAALARKASFQAFLIFDTASMIISLLAIWFLVHIVLLPDSGSQNRVASFSGLAVTAAFYCMVVAFGTGVYAVIESRFRWLGITVMVSSCLMPLYVLLLNPVVLPGRLTEIKEEIEEICTLF